MQALAQKHAAYKTEAGSSLLKEVFKNCLFAIPSAENRHLAQTPPKCKTKASRNAAFKLLLELAKDSPHNFKVLAELIVNQSDSVDMGTDFSFSPGSKEKSSTGFLGLENQGATCYMNSLLQQLYNIPEFRQGILLAEEDPDNAAQLAATIREKTLKLAKEKERPDKPGSIEEEKPKDDLADNVLYQMQRMFAFLQESRKRSFDTSDFCAAYRDPDGRPVNPSVQMDANEFYNQLFDTLEQRLKKSSQEQLLRNIFGGSLSTQIIPTECEHRRERDEPFMSISVEVKNKSHLKDALNLFVEGELLTADNKIKCDICAKPVESVKRYVVKDLPPVLALHLKRFEFDYEKMKNEKLNSTCAFDMTLNVEPFTREGIAKREFERGVSGAQFDPSMMRPPSYYEYELTGIVVCVSNEHFLRTDLKLTWFGFF
jgi:ubiquitin carboxyl-terminal hydrolase 34